MSKKISKRFIELLQDNVVPFSDQVHTLLTDLEKCENKLLWLSCLEEAGVDNWEGCDEAYNVLKELENRV